MLPSTLNRSSPAGMTRKCARHDHVAGDGGSSPASSRSRGRCACGPSRPGRCDGSGPADDVGALGQEEAGALGQVARHLPGAQPPRPPRARQEADAHRHRVAGAAIVLVRPSSSRSFSALLQLAALAVVSMKSARDARCADCRAAPRRPTTYLSSGQVGRQHEAAEQVRGRWRRAGNRPSTVSTRSGLPSCQPSVNCARRRRVLGVALGRAAVDPGGQGGDFLVGQLALVVEGGPVVGFHGGILRCCVYSLMSLGPVDGLL